MEIVEVSQLLPAARWAGLAVLGLSVGSFLNVVICRLPVRLSSEQPGLPGSFTLLFPPSQCMKCHAAIRWYDNLPLISWALLKGKCRHCGQPISLQYPLVEAISLVLSLMAGLLYPPGLPLAGWLIFSWLLLTLSVIDINTFLLPDSLTLSLVWTGLLFNLNGVFTALPDAVTGVAVGYVTLRLLCEIGQQVLHKACMGYGDCKMTAGLAAWAGWQSLPALLLLASITGMIWLLSFRIGGKKPFDTLVPFGPSLAFAGWLMLTTASA